MLRSETESRRLLHDALKSQAHAALVWTTPISNMDHLFKAAYLINTSDLVDFANIHF